MSIFSLHSSVLTDYRDFVRSFFSVADDRAREFIDRELVEKARLWRRRSSGQPLLSESVENRARSGTDPKCFMETQPRRLSFLRA